MYLEVAAAAAALAEEALAGGVHGHQGDAGFGLPHHPLEAGELLALCAPGHQGSGIMRNIRKLLCARVLNRQTRTTSRSISIPWSL